MKLSTALSSLGPAVHGATLGYTPFTAIHPSQATMSCCIIVYAQRLWRMSRGANMLRPAINDCKLPGGSRKLLLAPAFSRDSLLPCACMAPDTAVGICVDERSGL